MKHGLCPSCKQNERAPYRSYCRACLSERSRQHQDAHRSDVREYKRRYYQENKDKVKVWMAQPNQREMQKARRQFHSSAIEYEPCSDCGSCENIDAHHEDYSKPLEVIFLCRRCHAKRHPKQANQ